MSDELEAKIANLARDMAQIRGLLTQFVNAYAEAEGEMPERHRRFAMYFHDIRDFNNMYHELGQPVPVHIRNEIERCDDRFRQLLEDLNSPGGAFDKIRREMSLRPGNRYDHTMLLPMETQVETGNGNEDLGAERPDDLK